MQFTISELKKLSDIENHKIIYDSYEYWWYSNKDKEFTIHFIKPFNIYKKALSYILYWQFKYFYENKKKKNYLGDMINKLWLDVKIKNICNNKKLKSKAKIEQVLYIKPSTTPIELSKLLDVTKMAISKQLKSIHQLC